jgi:hypothetical protein
MFASAGRKLTPISDRKRSGGLPRASRRPGLVDDARALSLNLGKGSALAGCPTCTRGVGSFGVSVF